MLVRNPVLPPTRLALLVVVLTLLTLAFRDWRLAQAGRSTDGPGQGAPDATAAPAPPTRTDLAALPLFGLLPAAEGVPPATDATTRDPEGLPESTAAYRLFGVLLAPAGAGRYALIGEGDDDQQAYREGDAAPDGARLKSVHDGWVVLERNGREERLTLTEAVGTGAGGVEGLPSSDAQSGEPLAPLAPAASPAPPTAAERLQARIRARRAAAEAGQTGPKND